jgi:hypothetical protein
MRITAFGLVLCMLPLGTTASAYTNDDTEWTWRDRVTTEGCRFTEITVASLADGPQDPFSWSGAPCTKGEFIDGEGTLTIDAGGGNIDTRSGRMIAGVFDGPVKYRSVGPSISGGSEMVSTVIFNRGCPPHPECEPATRPSHSTASTASTARYASQAISPLQRVIARDGTVADCVGLETLTQNQSTLSGGGRVFANHCPVAVEVGWCSVDNECERGLGNQWTVQPGKSWPVSAEKSIRWGACLGANTYHGDRESQGLKFTCSAPEGTPAPSAVPTGAGNSKES